MLQCQYVIIFLFVLLQKMNDIRFFQAYGAEEDRKLNIAGENLSNVVSATKFIGWYNGLPMDKNIQVDLDAEHAVIVGHGNVALDVARILLKPVDELRVGTVDDVNFYFR